MDVVGFATASCAYACLYAYLSASAYQYASAYPCAYAYHLRMRISARMRLICVCVCVCQWLFCGLRKGFLWVCLLLTRRGVCVTIEVQDQCNEDCVLGGMTCCATQDGRLKVVIVTLVYIWYKTKLYMQSLTGLSCMYIMDLQ
jgi:hypothetical protein